MSLSDEPTSPTPPAWDRLKDVVADALDRPRDGRRAFVESACGDDPSLAAEAASILGLDEGAESDATTFVLHPRVDAFLGLNGPDPAALAGTRFAGKYELIRLLGEGGMAAVYLARQDGVERPVALKVLRPHALGYDARGRFAREVTAQGRLDHPGIARIYDAGLWRDPAAPAAAAVPFLAMEYVDGPPLTRYADERELSLPARIRLLADVADAVHAAHQRAIVHRDLKPANVLVAPNGAPKVLDFGIARVLQLTDDDGETAARAGTLQTTAGMLMGTLGYMAPEQAAGADGEGRVDVRSDVWSLGVMLHELVTGRLPVPTRGLPLTEALRRLAEPDVTAAGIGPIPGDATGGDLTAVLTTALAGEPERRYPSAEALADDLRRMLRNEPVTARPQTRRYRARKFARRHRAAVLASLATAVALLAGAVVSTVGFAREATARRQADAARTEAERSLAAADAELGRSNAARTFVSHVLSASDLDSAGGGAGVTLLQAIRLAEPELGRHVRGDPLVEVDMRLTLARALRSLGDLDQSVRQYRLALDAARRVEEYDGATRGARTSAWLQPMEVQFELAGTLANEGNDAAGARAEYEQAAAAMRAAAGRPGRHRPRVEFEQQRTLASILDAEGRHAEAADLFAACAARGAALVESGENPVDDAGIAAEELVTLKSNAAGAMRSAGRVGEALALMREVVSAREAAVGAGNPSAILARHNLAQTLADDGQLDESEMLFRRALDQARAAVGADHPLTLNVRDSLTALLVTRQTPADLEEAIRLAGESAAAYRRLGKELSPDAIGAINNRATALAYLKRDAEAATAYREATERASAAYGPEHPTTLILRANLGRALADSGDRVAAVAQLREVYEAQRRTLGDRDPSTVITRNNLAMILLDDGKAAEAAAELRQCHAIAEQQGWGGMAPLFRRGLGKALKAAGDPEGAERELLRAYEELEDLGPAHRAVAAGYLAELYDAWDRPAEARRWHSLSAPATAPADQNH